jgi:Lrp/AsnC family leucine-responsive transcriptional regulator
MTLDIKVNKHIQLRIPSRSRPMDDVDQALIEALRANARTTYAELGRLVAMSGPSVAERVQRLEQSGVITGYHASVDPQALGLPVAALVGVHLSDNADQDEVADALASLGEVEDCWFVAGDESFLIKVRVADMSELEATLSRLRQVPGIARTRTTVVLSTKWENRPPGSQAGASVTSSSTP